MRITKVCLAVSSVLLAGIVSTPAPGQSLSTNSDEDHRLIDAPPGFTQGCRRYQWICDNRAGNRSAMSQADLLELAGRINNRVNLAVTPLTDVENYGVAEYWSLPTNGNGDCEDYVLQKYKLLLDAGIDSRDLSIAIVLDRDGNNHAVLVLRHSSGDLVLDSLTSGIRPWNETGYTYLAMQSAHDNTKWEVVMNQPLDSNILAHR